MLDVHPITKPPKYMRVTSNDASIGAHPPDVSTGKNIHWTTDPTVELPIKLGVDPKNPNSLPPVTVMERFAETSQKYADRLAFRVKRDNVWVEWTWAQYAADVYKFAKACLATGLERFGGVSIIGFNSPEWFIANIGAIHAGGISTGIYTTNTAEAVWYVADHSCSRIAIADTTEQVEKFVSLRERLPKLVKIVQWTGAVTPAHRDAGVVSWKEFLASGEHVSDAQLQEVIQAQRPGQCCELIYTSGTTGNPKAVMLSHDNLTWTSSASLQRVELSEEDRVVSYLPLSHIAAQIIDIYLPMKTGASITFADPDALKGTLVNTLLETRPTIFLGVPRVWEKIQEKMVMVGQSNGFIKQAIGKWAKSIGLQGNYAKMRDEPTPWGWSIADKVIFSTIKKALGLDACRLRLTSAAPISHETLEYFLSLDMHILEIYGMSECAGPHTTNYPDRNRLFTVGIPFDGAYQSLMNQDAGGNGEICMWGRHVFMGYMYNEPDTMATIDKDGFLHTGDLGKVDADGFLTITGRIKELIITAGGENVAPVLIEDCIKKHVPIISNVMVIGDQKKFLSAIITLKTEPDAQGNLTDFVAESIIPYLHQIGVDAVFKKTRVHEIAQNEQVLRYIQEGIDNANKEAISAAQRVQKWVVLPEDFSLAGGELTPTLKLKRRVVLDKYKDLIAAFYVEAKL